MRELTDAGLIVEGTATLENVMIVDGVDGIARGQRPVHLPSLSYSTIADNTGVGVDNSLGGTADHR